MWNFYGNFSIKMQNSPDYRGESHRNSKTEGSNDPTKLAQQNFIHVCVDYNKKSKVMFWRKLSVFDMNIILKAESAKWT